MAAFAFTRALSDGTRDAKDYYCYCYDIDDGDNDINDTSKFVRLGCQCISHYHCLIQYIRSKLGDRLTMSLNGISCPYGVDCKSFKTLDEVDGDDTKIYYITTADLDNIVDYGINHPNLQSYLDEHECKALTHEEVDDLRTWINDQKNKPTKQLTDDDYDLFTISTTKACPSCGYRSTHYHGHQCHHISPARPPQRGGCPNCHINYCYRCSSTAIENTRDRGNASSCRCGYWSNFCHPIRSSPDIEKYIAINAGGIPYDKRCECVICSDCRHGKPCAYCPGDCCVCRGYVNPSPNEVIDTSDEEKKWKDKGPLLISGHSSSDISLWDCCRHGNDDALRQLLASGNVSAEDVNRQDREGRTALYLAIDAGHFECVRLLIAFDGISINTADRCGDTPLYIACDRGHTDIVRLLLSCDDIDVNIIDSYHDRPLHIACRNGHTDIVRLLISCDDIDVNIVDRYHDRPLHTACRNGHTDIVRLLISCGGISVNIFDRCGDTPLYIACDRGYTDIVRLLLSCDDIDVNISDNDGDTPLHNACDRGYTDIVRLLLSCDDIDVNIVNRNRHTPLHRACYFGYTDIVRLFEERE